MQIESGTILDRKVVPFFTGTESFTENGEGKGHPLTYSIGIDEQKTDEVMAETFSVQVLYTITEN